MNIGLAEALQSEFLMYGIGVHILFPGTIFSPGLIEENKVKPKITLKLEETDVGLHPDKIAEHLLDGAFSDAELVLKYLNSNTIAQVSHEVSSTSRTTLLDMFSAPSPAAARPAAMALWIRSIH